MKKVIIASAIIVGGSFAGLYVLNNKIDNEIQKEIKNLNDNGFTVKNQQSTNYITTSMKGDLEITSVDKAFKYLVDKSDNEDLKKQLMLQYSALDEMMKEQIFEGVTFAYDTNIKNIFGTFESTVSLKSLSKKAMYEVNQNASLPENKWLLDFLKNGDLQVKANEKGEYSVKDINSTIPDSGIIKILGWSGKGFSSKINEIKIADAKNEKENFFQLTNFNSDYFKDEKNENSKTTIDTIVFQDISSSVAFNLKNLVIDSKYQKDTVNVTSQSEINFDEVVFKQFGMETLNLKKSKLSTKIFNLPIKTVENIMKYAESKNVQAEKMIEEIINSNAVLEVSGNASNYTVQGQKFFETLEFSGEAKLNKNLLTSQTKEISDILEKGKLTVLLDEQAALMAQSLLDPAQSLGITAVNDKNNLKKYEFEVKKDGLYLNGKNIMPPVATNSYAPMDPTAPSQVPTTPAQ